MPVGAGAGLQMTNCAEQFVAWLQSVSCWQPVYRIPVTRAPINSSSPHSLAPLNHDRGSTGYPPDAAPSPGGYPVVFFASAGEKHHPVQ